MSSPERMELMERNISRLTLLIQQLGEAELANQQRQLDWLQWMEESDQRRRESDQRMQENERRMQESDQRMQENERRMQESDQRMQENERRMQENDQRMQENERRMQENDQRMQAIMADLRRLSEQDAIHAANIRAMLEVVVEIQTDVARIDAAS